MTIVVYRDGVMASDSQITCNTTRGGSVIKIHDLEHWIVGCAGAYCSTLEYIEWMKTVSTIQKYEGKIPDDYQMQAIVVRKSDGSVFYVDKNDLPIAEECAFHAIGSGSDIARGAMQMGANARQAVEAAVVWDVMSGGELREIKLLARPNGERKLRE